MLEFKIPEISDKEWIDECLSNAHSMNCEYTFGSIYIWHTAYSTKVARYKDFLSAVGAGTSILIRFLSAAVILKMPFCRL